MHPTIRDAQKKQLKPLPEVKPGYTVRIHQKIKEGNKERVQVFEGLVIKIGHGEGIEKTITVRKVVEGIGVEKVFPLHSPGIKKIDVKKKAKVRRSKLYYMRDRSGKSARLQERHVTDVERAEEEAKMEAMIEEAVKAEEKRRAEEKKAENPDAPEVSDNTAAPEGDAEGTISQSRPEEDAATDEPKEETPAEELKEEDAGEKPAKGTESAESAE
ncbi:50S ribosomal protein L19 [Candidatus Peregrinibacteria bacterium]|nr:50S ribosomal protein L19 [Candidatus Peregrinibacteria bacterium]